MPASWIVVTRNPLHPVIGIHAAAEISPSGDGAHVWVFFSELIPASAARSLGASRLREAMTIRGLMSLPSNDRFFLAQDSLPRRSAGRLRLGNLIALPLIVGEAQGPNGAVDLSLPALGRISRALFFASVTASPAPPFITTLDAASAKPRTRVSEGSDRCVRVAPISATLAVTVPTFLGFAMEFSRRSSPSSGVSNATVC